MKIDVIVGRIETLACDAIVNAANAALYPGGGVDGAIRTAAGPAMNARLAEAGELEFGAALVTPGFALPARHVIHVAAPIWTQPGPAAAKERGLARVHQAAIAAARAIPAASLAFPALGTGAFGWPKPLAARIAADAVRRALAQGPSLWVVFCCFSEADAAIYRAALNQ